MQYVSAGNAIRQESCQNAPLVRIQSDEMEWRARAKSRREFTDEYPAKLTSFNQSTLPEHRRFDAGLEATFAGPLHSTEKFVIYLGKAYKSESFRVKRARVRARKVRK